MLPTMLTPAAPREKEKRDFRDVAAVMANAFNSMRLRPDPSLAANLQTIQQQRTAGRAKNKTVDYLRSIGTPESLRLAAMVETGELKGSDAYSQMLAEERSLKDFARQKEMAAYSASLTAPKGYQYQQLASDLLKQGVAKNEQEALQMALANTKAGNTVNVGGADDFTTALMKEQAKRYEGYQEGADSAASVLTNLNIMNDIVGSEDFYSGFGADTLMKAKRAAVAFGADPKAVSDAETFQKVAKDSALQAMGGSLGVGFSNADRDFVEAMVPNISNTKEGNKLIIDVQNRVQQRKIDTAKLAEQYAAEKGNLNGFTAYAEQWRDQNPLFTEEEKLAIFPQGTPKASNGLSSSALSFIK